MPLMLMDFDGKWELTIWDGNEQVLNRPKHVGLGAANWQAEARLKSEEVHLETRDRDTYRESTSSSMRC